jgi:Helix-turn-helix domain
MADENGAWLDVDQMAARYHVTAQTVYHWRHSGTGPDAVRTGVKVGKSILFPAAEVERCDREMAAQARKGAA